MKETYSGLTVKQRVNRGWRWLDENFPGWQERVNIETLSMVSGEDCICGQLFGDAMRKANSSPDNLTKHAGHKFVHGYDYTERTLFTEANSWVPA